ncbi:MAG: hypothetical protein DCO96_15795 [Fluviicola sp. XM-24bin1]|nr:MAG: hypothetical protein DCO96_15795 [Fluviicola sp. XM-24bin1]
MSQINVDHVVDKLQASLANYIDEIAPKHFGHNLHVFQKVHIHFLGTFIGIDAFQAINTGLPYDKWIEISRALHDRQPKKMISFYKKYFDRSEYSNLFEPINHSVVSFRDLGYLEFWDKFESNEGVEIYLMSEMYYDGFTRPLLDPKRYTFREYDLFPFLYLKSMVFPSPEFDFYSCGYDVNYCNELIENLFLKDELIEFSEKAVDFANNIRTEILESSFYLNIILEGLEEYKAKFPSSIEVDSSLRFMRQNNAPPFDIEFKLKIFYEKIRRNHNVTMKSEADFDIFFNTYTAGMEVKRFLKEIFTDRKVFDTVMNDVSLQTEIRENHQFCWACFGVVMDLKRHDYFFKSNVSICQDCYKLLTN